MLNAPSILVITQSNKQILQELRSSLTQVAQSVSTGHYRQSLAGSAGPCYHGVDDHHIYSQDLYAIKNNYSNCIKILEHCNPWPHVANRHISISQLLSL